MDKDNQLIAAIFWQLAGNYLYDHEDGNFVLVTEKLIKHLISILDNSKDREKWDSFQSPYESWDDDDVQDLRKHIGEYIYLSWMGDPWKEFWEMDELPQGITMQYADDLLEDSLSCLRENLGEYNATFISSDLGGLREAVLLFKKNGLSDKEITRKVNDIIRELKD
jgi:hypothetical protein